VNRIGRWGGNKAPLVVRHLPRIPKFLLDEWKSEVNALLVVGDLDKIPIYCENTAETVMFQTV
jgi:hypothetical protein